MNSGIIKISTLLLVLQVTGIFGAEWDYKANGEDIWHVNFPACKGLKQSPIDILTSEAKYDKSLKPFKFVNYDTDRNWKIKKTGHNIGLNNLDGMMGVNGSDLCGFFKVENVHFHWGANDYQGSEHKINGEKLPLEMHVVHSSYKSNNYIVTGLVFQISNEDNDALEPLLEAVDKLNDQDSHEFKFNIFEIYPKNLKNYFRYSGSLTTPPCSEVVIWNVFKSPIYISSAQMERIRKIGPDVTFRHVQPMNGRTLFKSYNY